MVDLEERQGERLEPLWGTIIKATVSLYVADKRNPSSQDWVEAQTSAYAARSSQKAMFVDAEIKTSAVLLNAVRAEDFVKVRAKDDKSKWTPPSSGSHHSGQGPRIKPSDDDGTLMDRLRPGHR